MCPFLTPINEVAHKVEGTRNARPSLGGLLTLAVVDAWFSPEDLDFGSADKEAIRVPVVFDWGAMEPLDFFDGAWLTSTSGSELSVSSQPPGPILRFRFDMTQGGKFGECFDTERDLYALGRCCKCGLPLPSGYRRFSELLTCCTRCSNFLPFNFPYRDLGLARWI